MAKPAKIEKLGCQEIVTNGQRAGKSVREIAKDCSEWAGEPISHTAVQRYIESLSEKKKEVIINSPQAVVNVVHQDFDIIQTNLGATKRLLERFELVDNLPEYFNEKMEELVDKLMSLDHQKIALYLEKWYPNVEAELRRKVGEIAILNREVRENMKFLVTLREKAFQFELIQDYLALFMRIFEEESKDGAYQRAIQRIASNPRMQQIVEQQKQYTGGDN